MSKTIRHISDYIAEIEKQLEELPDNCTVVYRGETREYPTACFPNLFRKQILVKNPYFEKNQFDEMTANHLTEGSTYLEKAIDAQHGGFPSRLLDVTYNCLVALYFAVTPFYYEKECAADGETGKVYIFPVDKMYCPTGNNINRTYNMIINRKCQWINEEPLFQKNHKLIDHIKLNTRIVAQQGAFILFQGDEGAEIPPYQYRSISIDGASKPILRRELKALCGIHTGSIYPEKYNLVEEIVYKSNHLNAREFSFASELDLVLINLEKCLRYHMEKMEEAENTEEYMNFVQTAEQEIRTFKEGIELLEEGGEKYHRTVEGYGESLLDAKKRYNKQIEEFLDELEEFIPREIELSREYLLFEGMEE